MAQSKKSEDELQARKAPLQHRAADEACATGKAKITAQQTTLMSNSNSDNGQQDERTSSGIGRRGDGQRQTDRRTLGRTNNIACRHPAIREVCRTVVKTKLSRHETDQSRKYGDWETEIKDPFKDYVKSSKFIDIPIIWKRKNTNRINLTFSIVF